MAWQTLWMEERGWSCWWWEERFHFHFLYERCHFVANASVFGPGTQSWAYTTNKSNTTRDGKGDRPTRSEEDREDDELAAWLVGGGGGFVAVKVEGPVLAEGTSMMIPSNGTTTNKLSQPPESHWKEEPEELDEKDMQIIIRWLTLVENKWEWNLAPTDPNVPDEIHPRTVLSQFLLFKVIITRTYSKVCNYWNIASQKYMGNELFTPFT